VFVARNERLEKDLRAHSLSQLVDVALLVVGSPTAFEGGRRRDQPKAYPAIDAWRTRVMLLKTFVETHPTLELLSECPGRRALPIVRTWHSIVDACPDACPHFFGEAQQQNG
jgi:hypothetical protein